MESLRFSYNSPASMAPVGGLYGRPFCFLAETPPPPRPKRRAIVYIDGFNFYYGAIKDTPHKWLDLQLFCERLLNEDNLLLVRYFTSIMGGPSGARQSRFLGALSTLPKVRTILGSFKAKSIECQHSECNFTGRRVFTKVEEKRTDVGIAVQMVEDAYQNACDKLALVSGDSDLVPAVKLIRQRFPEKKVVVYTPTRDASTKDRRADELTQAAGDGRALPLALLPHCHLPDVVLGVGGRRYEKPTSWGVPPVP